MTHETETNKVKIINEWAADILPLLEKHPELKKTDLVIEGGVGTGITMPDIAHQIFPNTIYIGTDIASQLMVTKKRLIGKIDDDSLIKISETNNNFASDTGNTVLYASCFDYPLSDR